MQQDMRVVLNIPPPTSIPLILAALGEDEGRREHNLKLLETWLSCQSHLPKNYDRNLLVTFLRSCKHDMQRTKKKLELYFMTKTFDEVLYGNRVVTMEHYLKPSTYFLETLRPQPTVTMPDFKGLLNPPSEASRPSILEALREDEGRLEHNLGLLEAWASCQDHLPKIRDRNLLVVFLRGCKHDLQRTKKKLEHYFMARTFDEVLYGNRGLTAQQDLNATSYNYIFPLPELTDEGCRIILRGLSSDADSIYDIVSILRYDLRLCDLRFHHETLTAGDVYLFSGNHVTPTIVARFFSAEFRRLLKLTQSAFPTRLRQVHVFHVNPAVVKCVALIKHVLPEKLKRRIFIHSDLDSLYKEIPRRLLPSDLGGEQKSCREINEAWMEKVVECGGWFRELDGLKVAGPVPKQFRQELLSDEYGAEGSFRKLNID